MCADFLCGLQWVWCSRAGFDVEVFAVLLVVFATRFLHPRGSIRQSFPTTIALLVSGIVAGVGSATGLKWLACFVLFIQNLGSGAMVLLVK